MARRPEPWYWNNRKCWYVQVGGKQIRLDPDAKVARAKWHRMMAEAGRLEPGERRPARVVELVDLFLESRAGRRAATLDRYNEHMVPFAVAFKDRRAAELRAAEIVAYCNARPGWGPGTKRTVFAMVVTFYRWMRDAGYIDLNPMAGARNPWPAGEPRRRMTPEEYGRLMEAIPDEQFRLLCRVLWTSGCRPGEAFCLEASHLHPTLPVATLDPAEHKTGDRTGRKRYLIFPATTMAELRAQALVYPEGPILRNTWGRPWNLTNVDRRFWDLRRRIGLPAHVVPYAARHGLATDLATGNPDRPSAFMGKILGHSGGHTFESVYYHPDMLAMIEAVEKERGGATGPMPSAAPGS